MSRSPGSANKRKVAELDNEGDEGAPDSPSSVLRSPVMKKAARFLAPAVENTYYKDNCDALFQQNIEDLNQEFLRCMRQIGPCTDFSYFWLACEYMRCLYRLNQLYRKPFVGRVLTCGSNDGDCLGYATEAMEATNRLREVSLLKHVPVVELSVGSVHNAVLDTDGKLYTWGNEDEGATGRDGGGIGDEVIQVSGFMPSRHGPVRTPVECEDECIIAVVCGTNATLCLTLHGNVYTMGCYRGHKDKHFRERRPPDDNTQDVVHYDEQEPKKFPFGANWKPTHLYQMPGKATALASGGVMAAAILEDGSAVTWGVGTNGELGRPVPPTYWDKETEECDEELLGETFLRPHPVVFDGPFLRRKVISISCGQFHLMVVAREQGSLKSMVFASGMNHSYQLGLGDNEQRKILTPLEYTASMMIAQVECGQNHTLALDLSRTYLYACGDAGKGECGNLDEDPRKDVFVKTLQLVPFPKQGLTFEHIAAGECHNVVVAKPEGSDETEVYSWGYGDPSGALGHGRDKDEWRARKVNVTKKLDAHVTGVVRRVGAGAQHTGVLFSPYED